MQFSTITCISVWCHNDTFAFQVSTFKKCSNNPCQAITSLNKKGWRLNCASYAAISCFCLSSRLVFFPKLSTGAVPSDRCHQEKAEATSARNSRGRLDTQQLWVDLVGHPSCSHVTQHFWEVLLGDFEIGIGKSRKNPQTRPYAWPMLAVVVGLVAAMNHDHMIAAQLCMVGLSWLSTIVFFNLYI